VASPAPQWRTALRDGAVNAVTFASPSAVTRLRATLGDEHFARLKTVVVSAIGETTARSLRDQGLTPVVAPSSSLNALAAVTTAALATTTPAAQKV
jgi:uroporphyrinogen-III synthase